jgi:isocitrate dehydrogenase
LGQKPETLKVASYSGRAVEEAPKPVALAPRQEAVLVGVDAYVEWPSGDPKTLAPEIAKVNGEGLTLTMISNRGVKVWPDGFAETFCTDSFRCRFVADGNATHPQILALLGRIHAVGIELVKTEYLRTYGGVPGFSLAQGQ